MQLKLFMLCMTLVGTVYAADETPNAPVRSVAQIDLARYSGLWYEQAKFPMFFQRNCVSNTTAQYAANSDGTLKVINRCRTATGEFDQAEGKASVVEKTGNAQLKVSFFWPFKGDYWVIGLDPDYQWAVVGHPSRKYLWILSRQAKLAEADLQAAQKAAIDQGYDLRELEHTPQN